MNKPIRDLILSDFKEATVAHVSQTHFILSIPQRLDVSENDVMKELGLMRDEGLVESLEMERWRLTSAGERMHSHFLVRFKHYMVEYISTHWLAIIAVAISIAALLKK